MNSLAASKCGLRLFAALIGISSLFLTAGCGSSTGLAHINPIGFSNSSLSGTYVFSSQGSDSSGFLLTMAGAVTADGNGNIKGGTMDIIDPNVGPFPNQAIATGTYSVGSDGRGTAQLNITGVANFVLDFVLTSTAHGLVTEFDGNGTGSGTLDLQTAVPTLAQLAGSYAFGLGGIDSGSNPIASAGSFTLDSNGNVLTGSVQDYSGDGGTPSPLAGAATAPAGTSPGTISLNGALGNLIFDFYPVDASHWKAIETDFTFAILSGDVFTQTGATIPNGKMVFTMAGGTFGTGPLALGGVVTSDGSGNFSGGLEDYNNNGNVNPAQVSFGGNLDAALSGPGTRVVTDLTTFVPATQWVLYPSAGGLIMLETDGANVSLGTGYAQTSTSFAASQDYGFNVSAIDLADGGFEEDDIAQFATTSNSLTGAYDINDEGSLSPSVKLTGSYTPPDATGRGTATTDASGSSFVSFDFYVASNSTVLVLETDSIQIGSGIIELQSAPPGAMAASHVSLAHTMPRARGAFKHK